MRSSLFLRFATAAVLGCCLVVGCGKGDKPADDGGKESASAVTDEGATETSAPADNADLQTVKVAITGMT